MNLNIKQDTDQTVICNQLADKANDTRSRMQNWRDQAERLEDKIKIENEILNDLRQQRRRTGDDAFDIDIKDQQDKIINLERQVSVALSNARQWEAEAAMLDRQMIANNCDNFA